MKCLRLIYPPLEELTDDEAYEERKRQKWAEDIADYILDSIDEALDKNTKSRDDTINKTTMQDGSVLFMLNTISSDNYASFPFFVRLKKKTRDLLFYTSCAENFCLLTVECLNDNGEIEQETKKELLNRKDSFIHECEHIAQSIIDKDSLGNTYKDPQNPTEDELKSNYSRRTEIKAFIRQFLYIIDQHIIKGIKDSRYTLNDFNSKEKIYQLLKDYGFYLTDDEYENLEHQGKQTSYQYVLARLSTKDREEILDSITDQIRLFYNIDNKNSEMLRLLIDKLEKYDLANMAEIAKEKLQDKEKEEHIISQESITTIGTEVLKEIKRLWKENKPSKHPFLFDYGMGSFHRCSYKERVELLKRYKPQLFENNSDFGGYIKFLKEREENELPFDILKKGLGGMIFGFDL